MLPRAVPLRASLTKSSRAALSLGLCLRMARAMCWSLARTRSSRTWTLSKTWAIRSATGSSARVARMMPRLTISIRSSVVRFWSAGTMGKGAFPWATRCSSRRLSCSKKLEEGRTWTVEASMSSAVLTSRAAGAMTSTSRMSVRKGSAKSTSFARSSVTVRLAAAMSAIPSTTMGSSRARLVGTMIRLRWVAGAPSRCLRALSKAIARS